MRVLLLKDLTDIRGRKYKKEELLEQLIKKDGPLLGEVGGGDTHGVSLDKVSHSISNIMFEGDNLYGDVTFLNTPLGLFLKNIIEECPNNIRFGIRATGLLNTNSEVSDLGLITFDVYSTNQNSLL